MLLFEGEPALFFLFIISTLSLLVGGCLWGSGEDEGATTKMTIGIVIFTLGCTTTLTFFITYTIKQIRKKRKRKKEIERILQLQEEVNSYEVYKPRISAISDQGHDNDAVDHDERTTTL
ncbi:hypothetical protein MN116_000987 [Schistosoma mekongi]|uniref:Uncharacterized protein n=1 Tax=Schistosoma mekongi TaxID=38744 RepID=A0AAE1ZLR4_SCHME|nr:hypothetical protein MN116_000987 [Schistosoma mekongi]